MANSCFKIKLAGEMELGAQALGPTPLPDDNSIKSLHDVF